jgi:uncharacterized protein
MPEIEPIQDIARSVLVGRSPTGREDTYLFDHSVRVMRVAERLSHCREASQWRLDRFALSVAALFHQAATVRLEEERRISTAYSAATMSADDVREYSAELAGDRLQGKLPDRQLSLVQDIIRHTHNPATTVAEARILSDADNLDDLGALGIWRDLRRSAMEGRGVEDAVRTWQRRQEYGYWDTRIRDAFRMETARHLARSRLAAALAFMQQLAREQQADDLPAE